MWVSICILVSGPAIVGNRAGPNSHIVGLLEAPRISTLQWTVPHPEPEAPGSSARDQHTAAKGTTSRARSAGLQRRGSAHCSEEYHIQSHERRVPAGAALKLSEPVSCAAQGTNTTSALPATGDCGQAVTCKQILFLHTYKVVYTCKIIPYSYL